MRVLIPHRRVDPVFLNNIEKLQILWYNIRRKSYCVSLWAVAQPRFTRLRYLRLRKNALASKHFCFMV